MSTFKNLKEEMIVNGKLCFLGREVLMANAPPDEGWSEPEMVNEAIRFRTENNRTNMVEMEFHIEGCRTQLFAFSRQLVLMNKIDEGNVDLSNIKSIAVSSLHESMLIKAANINSGILWLSEQLGARPHNFMVIGQIGLFLKSKCKATKEETACMSSPFLDTACGSWTILMRQRGLVRVHSTQPYSFSLEDTNKDALDYGLPGHIEDDNGCIKSVPFFMVLLLLLSKAADVVCKYYCLEKYGKAPYLSASQSLQRNFHDGKYEDMEYGRIRARLKITWAFDGRYRCLYFRRKP